MNEKIARALSESRIYRDYTKAFREMTGVPLFLRPVEATLLPSAGQGRKQWSCAVLGQPNCGCKSCARGFERIAAGIPSREDFIKCKCGCCGAAVPIRSGKDLVALLHVGASGADGPPVAPFSARQFHAALKLLGIFAEQLGGLGNQMLVQKQTGEPPVISRAKEFILQHYSEDISSGRVAKELHLSRFYFCKLFKSGTGLTFTAHRAREGIAGESESARERDCVSDGVPIVDAFQSPVPQDHGGVAD